MHSGTAIADPQLPQAALDTSYALPTGGTKRVVNAGGDFQAAINAAQPGDIIELQAGATFTGNFTLPNKSGSGWIYIQTSAYASLPPPGTRVGPSQAVQMARLRSTNKSSLIATDSGAHNYRFVGIEFYAAYAGTDVNYNIIYLLGNPDNIIFDRVYIHANPDSNTYDGISTIGIGRLGVVDSNISDIYVAQNQQESHAIFVAQASGPTKIENNFLSAAGEVFLAGGLGVAGLGPEAVTKDLTIRGNHFFKPLSWRDPVTSGPNAGQIRKVKNLLELKEGNRVLIEGNVFEGNWAHAQAGYAILLTPRDGPVMNVTFRKNYVKNSERGFQITPADDIISNVLIEHTLYFDPDLEALTVFNLGGSGGGATQGLTLRHNTIAAGSSSIVFAEGGQPAVNVLGMRDNIFKHGTYGIGGTGTFGNPYLTVTTWFTNYDIDTNVLIGTDDIYFPSYANRPNYRNFLFADDFAAVGFVDPTPEEIVDFILNATSPYKSVGTDGKDIGADINALQAATRCTVSGTCGGLDTVAPRPPTGLRRG